MFERGCAIPAWGLVRKGVRASSEPRQRSWPHDLWTQAGAGVWGAEREYPAENIVPLVGGQGDAASRSRMGTATYNFCSKPLPVFK